MENSTLYFTNKDCKYFPCHTGADPENFNCIFCYCPLYHMENCPGTPKPYETSDKKIIRDCTDCTFPHDPKHYAELMKILREIV